MADRTGADRLNRKLKAMKTKKPAAMRRGLKKAIRIPFNISQKIVPIDFGPLKESGEIISGPDSESIVYEAPYAVVQHENLEFNHAPGKQAKYLEQPWRESRKRMTDIIKRETKE